MLTAKCVGSACREGCNVEMKECQHTEREREREYAKYVKLSPPNGRMVTHERALGTWSHMASSRKCRRPQSTQTGQGVAVCGKKVSK